MIQMTRNGVVLQELPSVGHHCALQNIQPHFSKRPSWFQGLRGWKTCETCLGYGRITILSDQALKEDGEDVFDWSTWTTFSPPIDIETTKPCPTCDGLGRVR